MINDLKDVTQEKLSEELKQIEKRLNLDSIEKHIWFPKYFQLETSRVCNARCNFCAIKQWDKSVPFMDDKLFNKIVDEMKYYTDWIEVVCIQRVGEPLMDKKIVNRVYCLKKIGLKRVNMATNVSLLTPEKARALLNAGLDEIMFSVDSVEEEIYKKMRIGLDYKTVMSNLEAFFRIREEINPDCIVRVRGVSFYDIKKSEDQKGIEEWENFWKKFRKPQDRIYMKNAHNWGNQVKWENYIPENSWVYHPCVLLWSTMHITAMGKVALCSMDYDGQFNMGDINYESISDVWKNDKWKEVRQQHASGNRNIISLCRGCRLFDLDFSLENWQQKQLYEN